MALKFEIKGREKALANVSAFEFDVLERIEKQLDETTKNIRNRERQASPVGEGKKYKKTIKRILNRRDLSARVAPMLRGRLNPLAHLLERGTAPHPIHPYGNKKVTVQHPGTKPMPHIEPAWEAEEPAFIRGIEDAVRRARP